MRVFGRAIRFGSPKQADIVIFEDTGTADVRRALPPGRTVDVYDVDAAPIWVGARVLREVASLLPAFSVAEARQHAAGLGAGLLKELRGLYVHATLRAMRPKAVVTLIDNSGAFSWLSRRCRTVPMIAIQNGARPPFTAKSERGYFVQHLFSLGQREVDDFSRFGHTVEAFHPVGSLRAGLYWDNASGIPPLDIVIVSTWRGNIGYPRDVVDMMRGMRLMDERLADYLRRRSLRAGVVLRSERGGPHWFIPQVGMDEETYYRSIYGDLVELIEPNFVTRNVYEAMRQSRLVVSCLSTAVLEGYGWGKKVLHCNFIGTDEYHAGLDPSIVTTDADPGRFSSLIDQLLAEPDADYDRRHARLRRYYIANPDDGRRTHEAIAEGIDTIIAASGS